MSKSSFTCPGLGQVGQWEDCILIAITWHQWWSSVNFYISMFFSETTGPIGSKLGRNVHWMVPYKVYSLLLIRSTQKKQEAQGCLHIYCYKLFIVRLFFMRIFFIAFLKSLSECYVTNTGTVFCVVLFVLFVCVLCTHCCQCLQIFPSVFSIVYFDNKG